MGRDGEKRCKGRGKEGGGKYSLTSARLPGRTWDVVRDHVVGRGRGGRTTAIISYNIVTGKVYDLPYAKFPHSRTLHLQRWTSDVKI